MIFINVIQIMDLITIMLLTLNKLVQYLVVKYMFEKTSRKNKFNNHSFVI